MAKFGPIPLEQIISRLRLENPWWEQAGAFNALANLPKRLYYKPLYKQAVQQKVRRTLVLMGPRRVGKTVLLHQFIKELMEEGTPRRKVCYISVDTPLYNNMGLEPLLELCKPLKKANTFHFSISENRKTLTSEVMQVHNGIRPQDILVLLKLLLEKGKGETLATRSKGLGLSIAEISKSIQRSRYSGLISYEEKIAIHTFMDFLKYGLSYTFPVKPGAPTRGIPTAISHPRLQSHFPGNELFIWPHATGTVRGLAIAPLYERLPEVVTLDEPLYFVTALVEVFRTGKTREKQYAEQELKQLLEQP